MNWYYWLLGPIKFKKQITKQYIQHTTFCVRKGNEKTYTGKSAYFCNKKHRNEKSKARQFVTDKGYWGMRYSDREWCKISDIIFWQVLTFGSMLIL